MYIMVICYSIETCHGHWEIINLSIDLLSKQPKSFYISKTFNKGKFHTSLKKLIDLGQIDLQQNYRTETNTMELKVAIEMTFWNHFNDGKILLEYYKTKHCNLLKRNSH